MNIYLEIGKKKVFAGALEWPGFCRSGKDEESARQALLEYAPRYGRVLRAAHIKFEEPEKLSDLRVVERLDGDATTDFGAPGVPPKSDSKNVGPEELKHLEAILRASWKAFEKSLDTAAGASLRKGPRGGGRELAGVLSHVLESNEGYLGATGWKREKGEAGDSDSKLAANRKATLDALRASASGEIPAKGPRGGKRWSARYFVRRLAWHLLDHAWEIEDRAA